MTILRTSTRSRRRTERGAAAVEMAIVLPLLVLLVFGIIEFGFIFNRWITVTHAAREGVRVYSLTGDQLVAEQAAEDAAPDLGSSVSCSGSLAGEQVQMSCSTTYDLSLYFFKSPVGLSSTARMRKE